MFFLERECLRYFTDMLSLYCISTACTRQTWKIQFFKIAFPLMFHRITINHMFINIRLIKSIMTVRKISLVKKMLSWLLSKESSSDKRKINDFFFLTKVNVSHIIETKFLPV